MDFYNRSGALRMLVRAPSSSLLFESVKRTAKCPRTHQERQPTSPTGPISRLTLASSSEIIQQSHFPLRDFGGCRGFVALTVES
jgi:hypothetical protein